MDRKIVTYGGYFERFMQGLTQKEKQKVKYGLLLLKLQDKISTRFVKYIRSGIYELRTSYNGNIFRVFFVFDDGNVVVLFNGFQKKTQKTPSSEITKALMIKERYYEYKRANDSGL